MTCRAPVPPLAPLFDTWAAGRLIHVIHDTAFAPESFNPGVDDAGRLRKPTRFAPIQDAKSKVVPYLYGGSTLDCSIFETVFHDVPIDAPDKFVDLDEFAQRGYGELLPSRNLKLVDLTSEGLHRLKVPKEELITNPSRDYPATARWALALHQQFADVDGLLWMSRQRDRDCALVLFGDRLAGVLTGRRIGGPLARNSALRDAVLAAALRAGIEAD
ncbi:MAG: RES family NAD+ phosphorylase [Proteobacteria bacterium]|nr:RES family NAD+ phosphorylase [Pseudomonadota bacterium]MBS0494380.1 RES family NAD+ phosphorylase [Pseudomonadota bacterium]